MRKYTSRIYTHIYKPIQYKRIFFFQNIHSISYQWVNNIYEFSVTVLQESQNGTTHFSEYVEIILCFILDLNAQNDWVKTTSIIPTDSTSSFIVLIKLY